MDTLNPREIERALTAILPGWLVRCRCHPNGSASLDIEGPGHEMFVVAGLVRSKYHGPQGIQKLADLLVEELTLVRSAGEKTRA